MGEPEGLIKGRTIFSRTTLGAWMAFTGPTEGIEKLHDYLANPTYERRVVVFYDVLGWQSEIESAGVEAANIGRLRRLVLAHSRTMRMGSNFTLNVSTFSDNVVLSSPVGPHISEFLRLVAAMNLLTSSMHFLLRGGIAVGDIYHDDEVVFGPALNRAYELENKVAIYPRIVVDEPVLEVGSIEGFDAFEDGLHFIDPFTTGFMKFWLDNSSDINTAGSSFEEAGVASAGKVPSLDGDWGLVVILNGLKKRLRVPLDDKQYAKVSWLFDRIALRLGRPLASSYPRP